MTGEKRESFAAVQIPAGTDRKVWEIASAWWDVPLTELLSWEPSDRDSEYASASRVFAKTEANAATKAWAQGVQPSPVRAPVLPSDPFARLMLAAESLAEMGVSRAAGGDSERASVFYSLASAATQLATSVQRHVKGD